jgi:hypothetical protein
MGAAARISKLDLEVAENFIAHARIDRRSGGTVEINGPAPGVAHYCMGIMDRSSGENSTSHTVIG